MTGPGPKNTALAGGLGDDDGGIESRPDSRSDSARVGQQSSRYTQGCGERSIPERDSGEKTGPNY